MRRLWNLRIFGPNYFKDRDPSLTTLAPNSNDTNGYILDACKRLLSGYSMQFVAGMVFPWRGDETRSHDQKHGALRVDLPKL